MTALYVTHDQAEAVVLGMDRRHARLGHLLQLRRPPTCITIRWTHRCRIHGVNEPDSRPFKVDRGRVTARLELVRARTSAPRSMASRSGAAGPCDEYGQRTFSSEHSRALSARSPAPPSWAFKRATRSRCWALGSRPSRTGDAAAFPYNGNEVRMSLPAPHCSLTQPSRLSPVSLAAHRGPWIRQSRILSRASSAAATQ